MVLCYVMSPNQESLRCFTVDVLWLVVTNSWVMHLSYMGGRWGTSGDLTISLHFVSPRAATCIIEVKSCPILPQPASLSPASHCALKDDLLGEWTLWHVYSITSKTTMQFTNVPGKLWTHLLILFCIFLLRLSLFSKQAFNNSVTLIFDCLTLKSNSLEPFTVPVGEPNFF